MKAKIKSLIALMIFTVSLFAQPVQIAPENFSTTWNLTPTFMWAPEAGATQYRLQVSDDNTFATLIFNQNIGNNTSLWLQTPLEYAKTYYWQVRSNIAGTPYSPIFTFYTKPEIPTLISPVDDAVHQERTVVLSWQAATGATAYTVEVSTVQNFATTVFSQSGITTTSVTVSGLNFFTQYYWRVKSTYAHGESEFARAKFKTKLPPPILGLPADNSVKNSIIPFFDWTQTAGEMPVTYILEISKDNTFPAAGLIKIENITNTEFQFAPPTYVLENDKEYYYRVKAVDVFGESDYSTVFKFRTVIQIKAVLSTPTNGSNVFTNPNLFVWYLNQVGTGLLYDFEISLNANMTTPVVRLTNLTEETLEQSLDGLPGNTKLYWRITTKTSVDVVSAYSNISYFKIQAPGFVAHVPRVSYPIGNTTVYGTTTTLYWYLLASGEGLTYDVEINTTGVFSGTPTYTGITDLYKEIIDLTPGATYFWQVRSNTTTATSAWSSTGKFKVFGSITPVIAVPTYPKGNTTVYTTNPTLYWYATGNTAGLNYDVQINTTGTFNNTPDFNDVPDMFVTVPDLTTGVKYYWRVRSDNGTSQSSWSATQEFTIYGSMVGLIPHPYSPATGSTIYSTDTVLRWYMNNAAEGLLYDIEVDRGLFEHFSFQNLSDQYLDLHFLVPGATYTWKVRSNNGTTPSNWSATQSFTVIGVGGSPVPVISYPKGGVHVFSSTQYLSWYLNGSSIGLTYDIQISNNGIFGTVPTISDLTDMQYELTNLLIGDLVYWRVRSNNGVAPSDWSTTAYFVVYSESAAYMPIAGTPSDGVIINTISPTLSWAMPVANNNLNYELQYADNPEMNNAITIENLTNNNIDLSNLNEYTTYYWRVRSKLVGKGDYSIYSNVESFGTGNDVTGVDEQNTIPTEYYMSQNYPNPFNPTTNIKFGLPNNANVKIVIYNILGQEIKTLINKELNAGTYNLVWNGTNEAGIKVPSGAYLYRITAGNFVDTKKLMLIK